MAAVTFAVDTADTAGSPLTSGAFTPAAGDLLVVIAGVSASVDAAPTCVSSVGGQTFSFIALQQHSATHQTMLFVCDQLATAVSQTVTVDVASDPSTGGVITVLRVAGMTRTGASAVLQTAGAEGSSGVTPNAVFAAAALTGNVIVGGLRANLNPPAATPPASFTEHSDSGYSTPSGGQETVSRDSGHTSATVTWGGTVAVAWSTLIAELDTTTAGGGGGGTRLHLTNVLSSIAGQPLRFADTIPDIGLTASSASPTQAGPIDVYDGVPAVAVGGAYLVWVSHPLEAVTIAGSMIITLWMSESNALANVGAQLIMNWMDSSGIDSKGFMGSFEEGVAELAVGGRTKITWVATPISSAFADGDRLRIGVYGNDAAGFTMAAGHTFNLGFGGNNGVDADGNSWIELAETVVELTEYSRYEKEADAFDLLLEDGSGFLLLEYSTVGLGGGDDVMPYIGGGYYPT